MADFHIEARALALCNVGRYAAAVPLLFRALAMRPEDSDLLSKLAYAQNRLKNHVASLHWADRAVLADPKNGQAHCLRAHALWKFRKRKAALAAAEEAARCAPQESMVHCLLTDLYVAMKKLDAAQVSADRARWLASDKAHTYVACAGVALARAERQRDRRQRGPIYREAERYVRQGLALDANSPTLLKLLAKVRMGQGKATLGLYYAAAILDPRDSEARSWLNSNAFEQFYLWWTTLVGNIGSLLALLACHWGLSPWTLLLTVPMFSGLLAYFCFRRFGLIWMTRQRQFQALPAPLQETLRGLALDRRGWLLYTVTAVAALGGGVLALACALTHLFQKLRNRRSAGNLSPSNFSP